MQNATSHALRYSAASAGLVIAGGAVGYGLGGADGALMGASLGSAMANFAVKCFVAGTPVWVPLDSDEASGVLAFASAGTTAAFVDDTWWQALVGVGFAAVGLAGFAATESLSARRRRNELTQNSAPGFSHDDAFASDEESWLDEVDILWHAATSLGTDQQKLQPRTFG